MPSPFDVLIVLLRLLTQLGHGATARGSRDWGRGLTATAGGRARQPPEEGGWPYRQGDAATLVPPAGFFLALILGALGQRLDS